MKASAGKSRKRLSEALYYDKHGILDEILEAEPIQISLATDLRKAILTGKRRWRLENISLKLDPLYVIAIKKIATQQAVPYQTLLRSWLAAKIKEQIEAA
jgi:predicted DNA binding CopG/RHH family protein